MEKLTLKAQWLRVKSRLDGLREILKHKGYFVKEPDGGGRIRYHVKKTCRVKFITIRVTRNPVIHALVQEYLYVLRQDNPTRPEYKHRDFIESILPALQQTGLTVREIKNQANRLKEAFADKGILFGYCYR